MARLSGLEFGLTNPHDFKGAVVVSRFIDVELSPPHSCNQIRNTGSANMAPIDGSIQTATEFHFHEVFGSIISDDLERGIGNHVRMLRLTAGKGNPSVDVATQ